MRFEKTLLRVASLLSLLATGGCITGATSEKLVGRSLWAYNYFENVEVYYFDSLSVAVDDDGAATVTVRARLDDSTTWVCAYRTDGSPPEELPRDALLPPSTFPIVVDQDPWPGTAQAIIEAGDWASLLPADGVMLAAGPARPLTAREAATCAIVEIKSSMPERGGRFYHMRVFLPAGDGRHLVSPPEGPGWRVAGPGRLAGTRARRVAFYGLLPFTFTLDVATSPFQLAALLFYAATAHD